MPGVCMTVPWSAPQRILQRAVAEAGAVLDVERIARTVAEAEDRRRQQCEGEAFLDAGELLVDLGVDLGRAAVALVERLEDDEGHAGVGRVGELQRVQAGEGDRAVDALDLQRRSR